ncbi:MAG: hypothetical protein AB1486_35165 [Planctomycetota bacterium]
MTASAPVTLTETVPVRQWVLTLPFALRFRAAYDKRTCRFIRRIFMREVLAHLRVASHAF